MREAGARYSYAGRTLASAVDLPLSGVAHAVVGGDDEAGDGIVVHAASHPFPEPEPGAWTHHWEEEDGSISLSLARLDGGFLLRVPDEADFLVSADAREVTVRGHGDDPDPDTLSHLLLDQVLPRVLAHQGLLVLHAAAVARGGRAILLAGGSGAGKSTLAAALFRRGWAVLCDDAVALDGSGGRPAAVPTYPGLRLNPDALPLVPEGPFPTGPMARYSDKVRVGLPGGAEATPPLSALFLLEPRADGPGTGSRDILRLPPAEACMALIRNSFQLDLTDGSRQARQLELASSFAERLPVYSMRYPRDFASLDQVCAALTHAEEGG